MQIFDLRERPEFFNTVADRVWRAWWDPSGHPYSTVSNGLLDMMKGDPISFAVVAADGDRYLGSTLGIACDLPERRQYAPWVAAVWVEPEHRRQEVGRALVRACGAMLFRTRLPARLSVLIAGAIGILHADGMDPHRARGGEHNQTVYVLER
ncbi:GNAT family N-acetyltransferase [Bradyrhizobium sp. AUGA SZCCT0177]|uniref:GNAT family N-acetyltransferase n=1 Tax=Bradyrhizobium sp. AUGA SZCCT0177 TaxID=2807665 RepID=UPI001BA808B9|nr:GNAT family N-acetyltransferase [Bradyrhizobium sp. AUGA SZCCT0177]MBR1284425.1 GNAT family N-acetyltransferase [Bradyrhizobium sp. AUGA SZCCT0177]